MELNADFHIHGRYSGGTSDDMNIPLIASHAPLKGLDVVATADALHSGWRKHLTEHLREKDGLYVSQHSKTRFIIQTEIEDKNRVHHILLLPSLEAAESLHGKFKPYSKNLDTDGRPNIDLGGEDVVGYVNDAGGLVGPSHAFTPWTSIYKSHDCLRDCYGANLKHVHFLELGLSADTDMADRISELKDLTFMSNSDCHSPWPHRLGREFNKVLVENPSFEEIVKALKHEGGRGFTLNAGLNPLEGKYHVTACTRCFLKFNWSQAQKIKRRCPECGGLIKKGVEERAKELADLEKPAHPRHRPPYLKIIPLAEAISLAYGIRTITSKKVKGIWDGLVGAFGTEIKVLLDVDLDELKEKDAKIASVIELLRQGKLRYVAGGGGRYGHPTLANEKDIYYSGDQKTIGDYCGSTE
ncbi:MAG: TIGR00375 family protein [Candidatus Altiarchaeota archaeon]|nr:TIGR00375 family protein [Candidatus Altiarchaeota archaeon]